MTSWIDPDFEAAATNAGLIALAEVEASNSFGVEARVLRVLAGQEPVGDRIKIRRGDVIGRGHAEDRLPLERFLFIVKGGGAEYVAFTDTYWWFRVHPDGRAHIPIRDPFTRAYVLVDDLEEFVALLRDRSLPREPFVQRQLADLATTPTVAKEPIHANAQVFVLEVLALLGDPTHGSASLRFLGSPHYQVRWSAVRALGKCGAPGAISALVGHLGREDVPPIQAAIGQALLGRTPTSYRAAIADALPRMSAEETVLSRNVMSPVMNMAPAPRKVLEQVLARMENGASSPGEFADDDHIRYMLDGGDRGTIERLWESKDAWGFGGPLLLSKDYPAFKDGSMGKTTGEISMLNDHCRFEKTRFALSDTGASGWAVWFQRGPREASSGSLHNRSLCGWVPLDREPEVTGWIDFLNHTIAAHLDKRRAAWEAMTEEQRQDAISAEHFRRSFAFFESLGIPVPRAK
jgi:hypothetical protein